MTKLVVQTLPHSRAHHHLPSAVTVQDHLPQHETVEPSIRPLDDGERSDLLRLNIAGDFVSAIGVTLGVAPFMTVIDKAIVEVASGSNTIIKSSLASVRSIISSPVSYVKSPMFLAMWATYASTYCAANSIRTLNEHYSTKSGQAASALFVGTTAVNSSATMMKDSLYAKAFGGSAASPRPMPSITYGLWGLRDCLVISSSFVLPPILQSALVNKLDMEESKAKTTAQIFCPIATQFIAGPVQLLGLDYYNRPGTTLSSRLSLLASEFTTIVSARIARIAPAYGIGGVGNNYVRDRWRSWVIHREMEKAAKGGSPDRLV
eukprot:CAMPEP_0118632598 /NCGR_PEP_ID=MMETSP0785-20121206/532_1 /TAXON_ID=91992 /ORGANISM="Bolidomonas pacifica, Strain CCMP 1866" /LENGTH=318 /DNA_ID=CAMNT_0006523383 /DNA_START=193 /DNA_END=1146 /DNA_ORIENTATION=+